MSSMSFGSFVSVLHVCRGLPRPREILRLANILSLLWYPVVTRTCYVAISMESPASQHAVQSGLSHSSDFDITKYEV